MADLEKTLSFKINSTQAIGALKNIDKLIEGIGVKVAAVAKKYEHAFGTLMVASTYKSTRAVKRLDKRLKDVKKGTEDIGRSSKKAGQKLEKSLGRDGTRAIKKLGRAADKTKAKIRGIGMSMRHVGQALQGFGRSLTRYVSLPLAALGAISLKTGRDMNAGMAKIATLMPGQATRVRQLKHEIQELSKASGVATGDLAEGTYAAISAWGDSEETMKRMDLVVRASQAGYASTEETLNLLASITETYGDNTLKATEHLSDMAFVTNKLAIKAPFAEMAASMPKVANIAKGLNITQEQLFATMTAGAGVTGNVTEVSTQMRSMFTALTKETPKMEEVVKKLNKEFGTNYKTVGQAIGNDKIGLMGFLNRLKDGTKNSKEFQQALGGRVEGLNIAMALTGSRAEKYNQALSEMINNTGQTEAAHREVTDGINKEGFAWERTKKRIVVMSQRIGDKLIPMLDKLIDKAEPLLKYIEDLTEMKLNWAIKIGLVAIAIGPLLTILGGLLAMLGKIGVAIKTVAVISGIGAGAVVLAFAGIAAAIVAVYRYYDTLVAGAEIAITAIVEGFWRMARGIVDAWNWAIKNIPTLKAINWAAQKVGVGLDVDTSDMDKQIEGLSGQRKSIDVEAALERDYIRVYGEKRSSQAERENLLYQGREAANISKYADPGPAMSDEWAMQSMAAQAPARQDQIQRKMDASTAEKTATKKEPIQQTIDASVQVNVNAANANAKDVGRIVEQKLKRAQKQQGALFKQAALAAGASEQ